MKKRLSQVLFASLIILIFTIAYSNGGYFGNGNIGNGHLQLMESDQLEIKKETLTIDLFKGFADVRVEYEIKNTGDDIDAKFGYPCLLFNSKEIKSQEISDYIITSDDKPTSFKFVASKSKINGIKVPYGFMGFENTDQDLRPNLAWYFSNLQFKKKETKKIVITYSSQYQANGSFVSEDGHSESEIFRYLISFGATWKGPIQKGTVIINARAIDPSTITISPQGKFIRNGDVFTWTFKDLKPTGADNITINFNNNYDDYYFYTPDPAYSDSHYIYEIKKKYYLPVKPDSITASSFLKDNKYNYNAQSAIDANFTTAWVEGKEDEGLGEYLQMSFNKPVKISSIGIIPGVNNSKEIFQNNNRVSEVEISIDDAYKKKVNLPDGFTTRDVRNPFAYCSIDVSDYPKPLKKVKITITKVIRGKKYNDTAISEILLLRWLQKPPGHLGAR